MADWKFADGSRFSGAFGSHGRPEGLGRFVMASGNMLDGSYTSTVSAAAASAAPAPSSVAPPLPPVG